VNEQPKIAAVMHGGMRTEVDVMDQGNIIHQWVRKAVEPLPLFDPRKEKETYQQARKELVGAEWIASTSSTPPLYDRPSVYDMPPVYDHSERKVEKVSTLKDFLRSCLELMKDESSLSMLHGMIDHCTQEKEIHVHT
jgi:hypothetical protein